MSAQMRVYTMKQFIAGATITARCSRRSSQFTAHLITIVDTLQLLTLSLSSLTKILYNTVKDWL